MRVSVIIHYLLACYGIFLLRLELGRLDAATLQCVLIAIQSLVVRLLLDWSPWIAFENFTPMGRNRPAQKR